MIINVFLFVCAFMCCMYVNVGLRVTLGIKAESDCVFQMCVCVCVQKLVIICMCMNAF